MSAHLPPLLLQFGVVGILAEPRQQVQVGDPLLGAQHARDQVPQLRVAERKPPPLDTAKAHEVTRRAHPQSLLQ